MSNTPNFKDEFDKTFILGLGNQKCGTTWFYKYLEQADNFAPGCAKEYHIWDAADLPWLFQNRIETTMIPPSLLKLYGRFLRSQTATRYTMQNDHSFYYKYFCGLLNSNKNMTADITPSYSALNCSRMAEIKEGFNRLGVGVKALILVREPLSRIKSAVRFNLDKKNYYEGITYGLTDFQAALEEYYKSEHCAIRTNYHHTINEAEKVFNKNELYIGLYETMFGPTEIKRMSKFFGLKTRLSFANVRVNKTKSTVVPTALDKQVKEHYKNVYTYFYQKYPETKELW